jgi:hypothetical protein
MKMKPTTRQRLLAAVALASVGFAAGVVTTAPAGCASNCASSCPNTVAVIGTTVNVDPGIAGIAWDGPACPPQVSCRGDDRSTFCNQINVSAVAPGHCDVLILLEGRDPMGVRVQFGPPSTVGCCRGYPVVGESTFVIPLSIDAGIQGIDGPSDAVRIFRDAGAGGSDASDDAGTGGSDASDEAGADTSNPTDATDATGAD